jgi:hypothetical protein
MVVYNQVTMNQRAWLECEIHPGSLSREYAVTIKTADGNIISLFAPAELIRTSASNGGGLIAVDVLDRDANFGLVSLPRPALEGGSVAKVPRVSLTAA